jgi:hypothetical protein
MRRSTEHKPVARRLRGAAAAVALIGLFVVAWAAPIPALGDAPHASVSALLHEHLPGWRIASIEAAWEGGTTVELRCGGHRIGVQLVPGHGLPAGDVWLQPADDLSAALLTRVSDYDGYLIWLGQPLLPKVLACSAVLAGDQRDAGTLRLAGSS